MVKNHRVSPSPSLRPYGPVFLRPYSSVSACKPAPRQSFCRELPAPVSCREPLVCEALAASGIDERVEPRQRVIFHVPFVQPKRELIDIAEQVFLARVMINAMQSALQDRPNALDAGAHHNCFWMRVSSKNFFTRNPNPTVSAAFTIEQHEHPQPL